MSCDIIIPVWNQLEYTKNCLASLFASTRAPFKLIIVDNASDACTAQYLDSIKENNPEQIILIRNTENLGFVQAANQGIKQSTASYVCLLNNDTQVASGWLTEMLKVAESRKDIGIVNANSNTLGCKPKKGQSLEALARELNSYSGEYSELAWASGFCMLIKRKVVQEVGLFDQIYGMGTFEDADFSKRAQRLGYICVCAKASYVYHRERRSFIRHKRFDQNFEHNRQVFHRRWGRQERLLFILCKDKAVSTEATDKDILKLARQGDIIWIFLKEPNKWMATPNYNISVYNFSKNYFNLISLWRICKRKKKFDKIYVDNKDYARLLNNVRIFHKAEVIYKQL